MHLSAARVASAAFVVAAVATAVPQVAHATPLEPARTVTWTGQNKTGLGGSMANNFCDYNGDGTGDVITSDWMWRRTGAGNIGTAYVIDGAQVSGGKGGDIDATRNGVTRFEGPFTSSSTGFTVTCAGDVNNDGFDDVAYSDYISNRLFILYGEDQLQTRSAQYLGERGFIIEGLPDGRTSNYSAGIGDLNHDGFDDVAVVTKNSKGEKAGRIDIIAGADDIATVKLGNNSRTLTTITGLDNKTYVSNIAPAGDVNGDGRADYVVSGYTAVPAGTAAGTTATGMAWVLFGQEGGLPATVNIGDLGTQGFEIQGPARGKDRLGISLAAAGDVNHDGFDDILLGADSTGVYEGAGVLILGSASTATVTTDPATGVREADNFRGWWINGVAKDDHTGFAVAAADGTLVLGAYHAGDAAQGAVYMIDATRLDPATPSTTVTDLAAQGSAHIIAGTQEKGWMGRSVAAPGDLDHDGSADFAWAGYAFNNGRTQVTAALMGGKN